MRTLVSSNRWLRNHVELTKTRQESGHIEPEETCPEWECPIRTCSSQGPNKPSMGLPTDIKADQGAADGVYLCQNGRVQPAHGPRVLRQLGARGKIPFCDWLNIHPPYRAIRHTLCDPKSMAQWTKHSGKRYHQSLPYAQMLKETRVWLKVVMNCLIPGLHYTNITRDRVCLVYALMIGTAVNIGAVLKSVMRKAQVHKGHMYDFGGLITRMCRVAGALEENLDYMAPLFPTSVDITRTKGPDTEFGPNLITVERHRHDELIMAIMYDLEMLRHQNGCLVSTDM
ncbi:hypothetical protein H5410_003495 [Solanum commersonii]|uniref:Putative plant transposon protein domain-containing protein n=1 Tax=Solanum commersonii TaxID=4109 RepID=A0A9J6B592_SOLCO|nr:hypothetical protein H5410_003495 [Solanum commersonii]